MVGFCKRMMNKVYVSTLICRREGKMDLAGLTTCLWFKETALELTLLPDPRCCCMSDKKYIGLMPEKLNSMTKRCVFVIVTRRVE